MMDRDTMSCLVSDFGGRGLNADLVFHTLPGLVICVSANPEVEDRSWRECRRLIE